MVGPRMLGPLKVQVLHYAPRAALPRHHHARASLSLMLQGGQQETVGTRRYECGTHSAVLKGAGVEHLNQVGPSEARGLFVEMSPETETSLREVGGAPLGAACFADGSTRHLVRRIGQELRLARPGSSLIVEGLLFELLGTLVRKRAHSQVTSRKDARLDCAIDFLESNYRSRFSLADVAQHCAIHPSYLAELFRQRFSLSVGEWVRNRRLEFARDALQNPATPISCIAFQAGFADQSHLTRLFRAHYGVTPAEYRRHLC